MKPQPTLNRLSNANIRILQLENDLAAAKKREEGYRAAELKLHHTISALRNQISIDDATINKWRHERDDWRDAFKTVSRLVK